MNIFRQLGEKSWETPGITREINDRSGGLGPAAKTMLKFFLAVLSSMFLLFVVGYRIRMEMPDWVAIADPELLWLNTALLIVSSVFMQRARSAANEARILGVRNNLTIAGLLALAFFFGQYLTWGQLHNAGYYAATSSAAAFFFLLTALHGIHLFGGWIVLGRTTVRAWQKTEVARIKLSIELCTTYWHYLLLVWLVFFALLIST